MRETPSHETAFRSLLPALLLGLASTSFGNAYAADAPVVVEQSKTARIVREFRVTGTVTSPRNAALSAQVGGLVSTVNVDAGDRVTPGDILVELDRELASHRLAAARAEKARAEAALADAQRRLEEGRELIRDRTIPESDFESLAAEVDMALAALAAADATAREQAAVLERHLIRAPFAGVISRRLADIGEWVSPGTPVFELVAVDKLRFDFAVPQELFPQIRQDTEVELSLDALPGQPFPGRIQAVVPVSDPNVRTFLLRAVPAGDTHPATTPGMSAQAKLRIDSGRDGIVVPKDALLRYPDGRLSVWIVENEDGQARVQERQVRLGAEFGNQVEIAEGLAAGATVVVEGNEVLQDGQAVSVRSRR